mmetsp:Transcript_125402/g.401006  ORF Transcript_125402/g.401006 Transcript_125402/m.401006 type:complete len:1052 (+) Transcript_125402:1119-4274(+)
MSEQYNKKDGTHQALIIFSKFESVRFFGMALLLASALPACSYFDTMMLIRQAFQQHCISAAVVPSEAAPGDVGVYLPGLDGSWDAIGSKLCREHGERLADDFFKFAGAVNSAEGIELWEIFGAVAYGVLGVWLMIVMYYWAVKRKQVNTALVTTFRAADSAEECRRVLGAVDVFMADKFSTERGIGGVPALISEAIFYAFRTVMHVLNCDRFLAAKSFVSVPLVLLRIPFLIYSMFSFYSNPCRCDVEQEKATGEAEQFLAKSAQWKNASKQLFENTLLYIGASPNAVTLAAVGLPFIAPCFRCFIMQSQSFSPEHFVLSFAISLLIRCCVGWALFMVFASNVWKYHLLEDLLGDLYHRTIYREDPNGVTMRGAGPNVPSERPDQMFLDLSWFSDLRVVVALCGFQSRVGTLRNVHTDLDSARPDTPQESPEGDTGNAEKQKLVTIWNLMDRSGEDLRRWICRRRILVYNGVITGHVSKLLVWALILHLLVLAAGIISQSRRGIGLIKLDSEQLTEMLMSGLKSQGRRLQQEGPVITREGLDYARKYIEAYSFGSGVESYQIFLLCDLLVCGFLLSSMLLKMANVNNFHDMFTKLLADAAESIVHSEASQQRKVYLNREADILPEDEIGRLDPEEIRRQHYVEKIRTTVGAVKEGKKGIQVGLFGRPITFSMLLTNVLVLVSVFASELKPVLLESTRATCSGLAESALVKRLDSFMHSGSQELMWRAQTTLNAIEASVKGHAGGPFMGEVDELVDRLKRARSDLKALATYARNQSDSTAAQLPSSRRGSTDAQSSAFNEAAQANAGNSSQVKSQVRDRVEETMSAFSISILNELGHEQEKLQLASSVTDAMADAVSAAMKFEIVASLTRSKRDLLQGIESSLTSLASTLHWVEVTIDSLSEQIRSSAEDMVQIVVSFCQSARQQITREFSSLVQNVTKGVQKVLGILDQSYRAVQLLINRVPSAIPCLSALIQQQVCEPLLVVVRNVTEQVAQGNFSSFPFIANMLENDTDTDEDEGNVEEEKNGKAKTDDENGGGSVEARRLSLRGSFEM